MAIAQTLLLLSNGTINEDQALLQHGRIHPLSVPFLSETFLHFLFVINLVIFSISSFTLPAHHLPHLFSFLIAYTTSGWKVLIGVRRAREFSVQSMDTPAFIDTINPVVALVVFMLVYTVLAALTIAVYAPWRIQHYIV